VEFEGLWHLTRKVENEAHIDRCQCSPLRCYCTSQVVVFEVYKPKTPIFQRRVLLKDKTQMIVGTSKKGLTKKGNQTKWKCSQT